MLFVFICAYWFPTRFPYQMMFVLSDSNSMGVTSSVGNAYPSGCTRLNPGLVCVIRVAQSGLLYSAL